ncbi:MAG: hypothetical protein JNL40_01755 [Cyclobacteriaceae bacterium]|nr:hypothetical protein [Cyclobacteriaceae bacterium]
MRSLLIAIGLLIAQVVTGQHLPITVNVESDITWAGIDRAGDLFVVLANGEIQKHDKSGKKIGSHHFNTPPTLLDPLDGVQSFFYFREGQRYGTMSYDFSTVNEKVLDPAFAVSPWLVCPALRELWILDSADFSIKKTAQNSMTISLENTLKHLPDKKITDYVSLREYQNYVFLLDKSAGVHMFNPLGRYVRTLGESGMTYFNFLGEELYYLAGQELVFVDLYTAEKRKEPLDGGSNYRFALLNEDTLYGIGLKSVTITAFKP